MPLSPPANERQRHELDEASPPPGAHRDPPQPRSRLLLWALGALFVGMAALGLPERGWYLGVKGFLLETAGILLAGLILVRGDWTWARVRAALQAPPNLAILLFLLWVGLSAALSNLPQFSRAEALRHLGGGLVYFALAYGISPRRDLPRVVLVFAAAAVLTSFSTYAIVLGLPPGGVQLAYRNGQLLSSVLGLLLPVILLASQSDDDLTRRSVALAATVLSVLGIVASRNRSVWLGSSLAVLLLVFLQWKAGRAPQHQGATAGFRTHQLVIPVVVVVLAAAVFLGMSRMGDVLTRRASTLSSVSTDYNFRWRLGMWQKALWMVQDRPLLGWGVGTFPVNQALYYHPDCPNRQQAEIVARGPGLSEDAHNIYAQTAAELGIPGLLLYLAILITFFVTALRALSRLQHGFRSAVLIGCVAGIAGQAVSSIGNPAWEFPECSLFFWAVLGLGMALSGLGDRGREPIPVLAAAHGETRSRHRSRSRHRA